MLGALAIGVAGAGLLGDRGSSGPAAINLNGVMSDFSVSDLRANSVTTDVLNARESNGMRSPSGLKRVNGGEMNQNAVDDLPNHGGTIIGGPATPNDLSGQSNTHSNKSQDQIIRTQEGKV